MKMHWHAFSAGSLPRTPLGNLTVLLRPLNRIKASSSKEREEEPTSKGWEGIIVSHQSVNQSINMFVQMPKKHWTGHQGRMQPPLTGAHKKQC